MYIGPLVILDAGHLKKGGRTLKDATNMVEPGQQSNSTDGGSKSCASSPVALLFTDVPLYMRLNHTF